MVESPMDTDRVTLLLCHPELGLVNINLKIA